MPTVPALIDHGRLHKPLLTLHAAMEMETLWKAVNSVLRATLDVHRVTLFLGHIGLGEARFARTDPPIERTKEWYSARGRQNPFSHYIDTHPGVRHYRFSDILPPAPEFKKTEFYRKFARQEGWDKGVTFLFWDKRALRAMFSLYRTPGQPDFDDEEIARLNYLHPFIETAIIRVQKLHTERLARRSLEEFAWHIPIGLVLLEWDLKVEFANPEARKMCADWNLGPDAAKAYNARDVFAVPEPVLAECKRLREAILARDPKELTSLPGDVARVNHPYQSSKHAQITVLKSSGSALAKPRFLVMLDEEVFPLAEPLRSQTRSKPLHLPALTPSEKEIVDHVCSGLSNAEIARALNKSVLTVKTQLNSVFRKLGVSSRAKLITGMLAERMEKS